MDHLIWLGFAGGLLSFAHCLGMCGGFVLHLSQETSATRLRLTALLWHTGRLFTYIFLGACAGYAGDALERILHQSWLQQGFAWITGAVMIAMGAMVLGLVPVRAAVGEMWASNIFVRSLFPSPSPPAALVLGITTGCLPCPVLVGFLAYALDSRSVPTGIAVMTGVGLGTLPPLLLLGALSQAVSVRMRTWGKVAGGALLLVLGATTILRGTAAFHRLLGCGSPQVGSSISKPHDCCTRESHATGHR